MRHYRRPFLDQVSREPLWRFPNVIPIEGKPVDVWEKAEKYLAWVMETGLAKLVFWGTPAVIITKTIAERLIQKL
jgi:haloalkane dehalogenase